MKVRRFCAGALVVLALGAFLVACGDDDDTTAASGGDTTETTAATGGDAKTNDVPTVTFGATDDVAAKKFTFDVPSDIKGGAVRVELDNKGKELHDLQFVKASPGHTLDELLKTVDSEESSTPEWIAKGGGVGTTAPGTKDAATVVLEPGSYWYFCTESSGDDANSISHAANGMAGELEVGPDTGATLPDTDASITASEYKVDVSGVKAGENTFTFENAGKQLHHVIAAPIAEGKTIDDVKTAFASEGEPSGPPPIDFEHALATAVVGPGQSEVATWDLKPGRYAMFCFMTDYNTPGPPHVAKGMLQELDVK
jgi:plastocyanin